MTTAIRVENLSKAYQIGQIGTGTLSRDIERWWVTRVMKKEDPFLKLGETNDRTTKSESNVVWSLKDINFEVNQGDAVGIIGRNGAGKSTLLKLLSRVTAPTTGIIKIKGRVASLLEIGTGFHPELTGRENIYLNGSILGMRKREIDRKLDEIVDFSGVERYIDTPVKRYSSGMSVRLAFAVAAHLESEILIVDEVLAVGDAEFQKKCLGKMGDIRNEQGRTLLFVSHNMGAITELCNSCLLISNGTKCADGKTSEVIKEFYSLSHSRSTDDSTTDRLNPLIIQPLKVNRKSVSARLYSDQPIVISTEIRSKDVQNPSIILKIENHAGALVLYKKVPTRELNLQLLNGSYKLFASIPSLWLAAGLYTIQLKFWLSAIDSSGWASSDLFYLEIMGDTDKSARSILNPSVKWQLSDISA